MSDPSEPTRPAQRRRRSRGGQRRRTGRPTPGPTRAQGSARPAQSGQRAQRPAKGAAAPAPLRPPSARHLDAHELADAENQARVRENGRRALALAVTGALLPAIVAGVVLGAVVDPGVGAGAAAAVWVLAAWALTLRALPLALAMVGGAPVAHDTVPALVNQVEGLSATIGVGMPEIWLVEDPSVNACALAGRGRVVLVVTAGLLERLGQIEREGVLAHELVHIKRGDAAVSALALATAGLLAWATGRADLVHAAVGKGREYEADRAAVLAVRYPPGLHDALGAMAASGRPATPDARRWAATRWVWIDPMAGSGARAPLGELDATDVRMEALAEW